MNIKFFLVLALITSSCMMRDHAESDENFMNEEYRPQFHFSPASNWTNDPNGMFFLDGEYHLFYQHNPFKPVWGSMHWGHAVSKDMIHWQHLPIALYPDSIGYIYSGSAVVDYKNTSGLGTTSNPPVVVIYTYHNLEGERAGRLDHQTQGLAFSLDKGRTWTKYSLNPVLPNVTNNRDFRDPKVSWDTLRERWVMTLAVNDHIEFYISSDLKSWSKSGEFGRTEGAHGGVWECPDLLIMNDEHGKRKWVLLVSINPGAPNGGSGTQYFIGDFDGNTFIPDFPGENSGWVDYGTDNYAGVTFSNIPSSDGRTIAMGWMSNWDYAQVVPTSNWRNAMTVPREFRIKEVNGKAVLTAQPVSEFVNQRGERLEFKKSIVNKRLTTLSSNLPALSELVLEIERKDKTSGFIVEFKNSAGEKLIFGLDGETNQFYLDRNESGRTSFNKKFAAKHLAPRIETRDVIKVRLLLDASSIEVFADDGATVMTDIVFPTEPYQTVSMVADENLTVKKSELYSLKSIW